jgi:capsular exopolysaccharide synthesis family protein
VSAATILSALRAQWWFPVVGALLGAGVALSASFFVDPLYAARTQFFISATGVSTASDVFQGGQFSQQRVASYAELITGQELAQRVIARLDLDETADEFTERLTATAVANTVLINVTVTDESPETAQRIADVVGVEFTKLVSEVESPAETGASPVRVIVTERPELPIEPSYPRPARDAALGVLCGLMLGAGLAVLRARLDRSIKHPDEAALAGGAPVIGTIIRDDSLAQGRTIDRGASNRAAEDLRQLRANLQFLNVDEPPKVIMVTSAAPSEGKTTVVVNLALALAETERTVTVIEADLRRPKVTRYMGLVGGVGVSNILSGSAELDDVRQRYGEDELWVVAAGPAPPNPGELLASSQMFSLIDKLRGENDFVLVDAPPILPVADATGLAVMVDGVLLSVRYGNTRRDELEHAAATLAGVGARTLGVILNFVPPKAALATAYGDYGSDQRSS